MITGKRYVFVLLFSLLLGSGCSFHSNQLEALKTIFLKEAGPEPQWVVSWEDLTEKVFAVNAGSSIFFANSDGIFVHFNGAFVEKIEGVRLNSEMGMDISISKTELDGVEIFRFRGAASDLGDLSCEPAYETANDLALETGSVGVIKITQKCIAEDRLVYQSITLNQTRQVIGLQFFVHPAREPVTIRYSQIKELYM